MTDMKKAKPIILCFVAYYLPGYKSGGPVRTIVNMVNQMSNDFTFKIVTSDRDSFETKSYTDIKVNTWNRVGKADVYYLSPEKRTLGSLRQILNDTDYDILYLNSFFAHHFTIKPLILRRLGLIPTKPTVIAPRGEFSDGAIGLKSKKKRIYSALANAFGLYQNLIWQASSQYEKFDIKRTMGKLTQKISVAPDLSSTAPPDLSENRPCPATHSPTDLKIIFLSRISPKKNLDYILRVLAQVRVPIQLDLFGIIDDDAYWSKCRHLIKQLPKHIQVDYKGCIPHQEVLTTFAQYDLFFLPTKGENYGHVIYESLAAGTPALISDQTPWRDFEKYDVGWVLPLNDMQSFIRCIENFYTATPEEKHQKRKIAHKYAVNVNKNSATLKANKALFLEAF